MVAACTAQPLDGELDASPTEAPTPPASATQEAPPSPSASATATPFPVGESAEADDLFSRPDTCVNPEIGYTVTFPDDWYTNTAIGEQAACSWFTPDFYEVDVPGETPEEIWITIGLIEGMLGYNTLTPVDSSEEIEIDGVAGHRAEYRTLEAIDDTNLGDSTYHYVVPLEQFGPTLIAATDANRVDDYELAKAVLDRIMASMELELVGAGVPTVPEGPTGPEIDGDPLTAEDADGSFRLVLEAEQDRYRAGQEIEVNATLTYVGPADSVVAHGSGSGLIGFSVASDDFDPPVDTGGAFTTDCRPHEMVRSVAVEYPFGKSGGYSGDDPYADFYRAYFATDELRLPAGTWTISAGGGWYSGADCGDVLHSLETSVTIEVEP